MTVLSKTCRRCEETKSVAEFHKHKLHPDGLQPYCKVCNVEQRRERGKNREYRAQQDRLRLKCTNCVGSLRQRNDLNDITTEYLYEIAKHVTHCECCGCQFRSFDQIPEGKKVKASNNSMSFDAVDPDKGHWQGNIGIICHLCNTTKGNRNLEYWRIRREDGWRVADYIVEYMERYIEDDNTTV